MHRFLVTLLADLCLIALATIGAMVLRDNLELNPVRLDAILPYLGVTLAVAVPVIASMGLNRSIWRLSIPSDYVRVVVAALVIVLSSTSISFLVNRLEGVARALPVLQVILMIFALVSVRALVQLRHVRRRHAPALLAPVAASAGRHETVLVLGMGRIAELYLRAIDELATDDLAVAGVIGRNDRHTGRLLQRHPILGPPERIADVLRDLEIRGIAVDRIVVTTRFDQLPPAARQALLEVERASSIVIDLFAERMCLVPREQGVPPSGSSAALVSRPASKPVFSFTEAELETLAMRPYWRLKRAFDVVAAAALVVALAPAAILVAALVAYDVGLPVMFWQQRPGLGGRSFRLFKLRTMAAAHDAAGRRLSDAQRLSAIGRFLRRSRLDELPQLYHILVGEMSFVGPRPLLLSDQPSGFAARLVVRPGLTGWAQVKGGRGISMSDKTALDIWYVRNATFLLDLQILFRTVPLVVFGERVDPAAIEAAWSELLDAGICAPMQHGNGSGMVMQMSRKIA